MTEYAVAFLAFFVLVTLIGCIVSYITFRYHCRMDRLRRVDYANMFASVSHANSIIPSEHVCERCERHHPCRHCEPTTQDQP